MEYASIGKTSVSRFCIGGNPFSGFSHQSPRRNQEMLDYFTEEKIIETLFSTEEAGINSLFARADNHIMGVLRKYRDRGGTLQWFAQISPVSDHGQTWQDWLELAAEAGAAAAYIHGGIVDSWYAQEEFENFHAALTKIRGLGLTAGFAGHSPAAHTWIRDNLAPDFQMCSYYNPTDRSSRPEHQDTGERWDYSDREAMIRVIKSIAVPVIHYKVLAGGNKPADEAFRKLGSSMRHNDAAVIGIYPKDNPDMLTQDIRLFEQALQTSG